MKTTSTLILLMSAINTQAIPLPPVKLSPSALSVPSLEDTGNLTASLNDTEHHWCIANGPDCTTSTNPNGGIVGNKANMMSSIIIAGLAGIIIWGGV
jgi:hypothetical protein